MAGKKSVIARMDRVVNDFVARCRYFHEPMTRGRAKMFVLQHRLNTRQRNSVLKLKVATNCADWDTRIRIIQACSEEVIADHRHGGGRPHWRILEDLGVRIGIRRAVIQQAQPLPSTQLAWAAWEGLMASRHWLEGIVANTCAERCKRAIQTNNVDVDDRGYIYIVDRANTGMHILQLTGAARKVADFR